MANSWLERRVLNYAHQGGAREGPSSTLVAMRGAVEAGAHALELDVHCTADGCLVVCHDATVDRTTDGVGRIAESTLAELRALDNAYWWRPGEVVDHETGPWPLRGQGHGIATLEEVLDAFPGVFLNLDIKETAPAVPGYERRLAEVLRAYGRVDDVIVASFHDEATDRFRAVAPDVFTSAGREATAAFFFAVRGGEKPPPMPHAALQVPPAHEGTVIVDAAFVDAAHSAGVAVHVWTIDEPEEMQRLLGLGVDGIMTDRPSVLSSVLGTLFRP